MSDSRKESQGYMHLIHTVTGEYKPWTIYIVMEYSISFSMQKGKEFALKKVGTTFSKNQSWDTDYK